MSLASWSFALKSAAVSVANAVGSKFGCSPTVATSCPDRSTSSAQRALLSVRNFWSECVIAPKSSSVNDQLAEPTDIDRGSLREADSSSHLPPRGDRLRDRHAIRILEVAADGHPERNARDEHPE